jgi:hypothetical protein
MWNLNRSIHVTTRDRGKTSRMRQSIQFRQTPNRIRGGRIGTEREAARYSRLTPSTCGGRGGITPGATAASPAGTMGTEPLDTASGCSFRAVNWQSHGCSGLSSERGAISATHSGHLAEESTSQHGRSQDRHTPCGVTWATTVAHATKAHTSCFAQTITAAAPWIPLHSTQPDPKRPASSARPPILLLSFPGDVRGDNSLAAISQ